MTECVADHGCITCGDVAIPMRVAEIDHRRCLALCESVDGQRESVEIALVEPVRAGEWLLVHAGTALSRAAVQGPLAGAQEPLVAAGREAVA
ncbi:MAG TPA: HypC/HybG/HupF family hydrogenase formation chaperone [Solirubrobacteraceae bacterium]|jgi:hydrogenase assembly chaperone HypC/HupF|nr:HypC/HybG/HupF family hydrogenase formation chaperone [Solirubrobacteraceae bacterium]